MVPGLLIMFALSIFRQPERAPLGPDIYICPVMHYLAVKSSGYVFALRCHLLKLPWPVTATLVLSANKLEAYTKVTPLGLCFHNRPADLITV